MIGRKPPGPRIVALPARGIAYVDCLYEAVAKLGVRIDDGHCSGLWPLFAIRRGDLVHVHWPSFYYYDANAPFKTWLRLLAFVVRMTMVRILGGRIAWTAHNLYPHDGGRDQRVHRVGRRFITSIASTIFVHGPTAAGIVEKEFGAPPSRLVQIPHGHWIDHYPNSTSRSAARDRLGIPQSAYVYGFIGLCKPYKRLELLIDAFEKLPEDCVLLVAGHFQSTEYLAAIRRRLAQLPAAKLRFEPRFLPDDELQHYLGACDVMVTPYKEVLTSGSALLALSFGVPVIAPNMAGLRDVVDRCCGLLYDSLDRDGLPRALQAMRERTFDSREIIARVQTLRWTDAAQALVAALDACGRPTVGREMKCSDEI